MRRVICDTGPLLHLGEAGGLDLLSLTGEVHVPKQVDEEMRLHEAGWLTNKPAWIQVTSMVPPHAAEAALDQLFSETQS